MLPVLNSERLEPARYFISYGNVSDKKSSLRQLNSSVKTWGYNPDEVSALPLPKATLHSQPDAHNCYAVTFSPKTFVLSDGEYSDLSKTFSKTRSYIICINT